MLDALKKAFGNTPKETLEQNAPEQEMQEIVNANAESAGTTFEEQLTTAIDMLAVNEEIITELNTKLGDMTQQIEDYKQQLEALQGYAAEAEAKAAAIAAEAHAKEIADKKQKLADVIGAENAGFNTTWEAVAGLDAEAFNIVVAGFAAAFAKEADSAMFAEIGVSGEAEPVAETGLKLNKHLPKKTK